MIKKNTYSYFHKICAQVAMRKILRFSCHDMIHVSYNRTLSKYCFFPIFVQASHTVDVYSTVRTVSYGMQTRTFDSE